MPIEHDDLEPIHKKLDNMSTELTRSVTIQEGMLKKIDEHHGSLYDERKGALPRIRTMETTGNVFKWLAGFGFFGMLATWIRTLFNHG